MTGSIARAVGSALLRSATAFALVLVIGGSDLRGVYGPVSADDGTTTPVVTSPSPLPTPEPPTPTLDISPYPTAVEEDTTPVATLLPTATPAPETAATPIPGPHPTRIPPTPAPTLAPTLIPAPYVPPPSPAELRLDARLRWGTRVPPQVKRWAFLIVPAARKYGVDPNLVAAVMTMESNGDPSALSPADARGLMQVLHGPWDPRVNVFTGVHMLARFLQEFGSLSLALAAYNAGPNAVEAYGGIPPYRETRDYVIVVSYLYDLYGHRPLSSRRKQQYRNTLLDLKRFADQRKKVKQLARAGHVDDAVALLCSAYGEGCDTRKITVLFPTLDPFWPLAGPPDPLQRVSWPTRTNSAAGGKR